MWSTPQTEAAKGCCEACGAKATGDKPLDIDHIIPKSKAKDGKVKQASGEVIGVHDLRNLQVLCIACNRGKREHGDFDYRPSKERLVEAIAGIIKRASELEMNVDEVLAAALHEAAKP
jgi:5-methylcytosine-specific restriction endonuclease McrA